MKATEVNMAHTDQCDGYYDHPVMSFENWEPTTVRAKCDDIIISVSNDFHLYHAKIGRCKMVYNTIAGVDYLFKNHEVAQLIIEKKFNKEVHKFRYNKIPKWDGEPFVYEIAYVLDQWVYCVETDLDKIVNFWLDIEGKECLVDNNFSGSDLCQANKEYLSNQNFISKRANNYQITNSDINTIFKKLNNRINGLKN